MEFPDYNSLIESLLHLNLYKLKIRGKLKSNYLQPYRCAVK
jgi:hypothetical protein